MRDELLPCPRCLSNSIIGPRQCHYIEETPDCVKQSFPAMLWMTCCMDCGYHIEDKTEGASVASWNGVLSKGD